MWCVVITMTTVGYGDVFSVSPFGRIISIINALWGAFVISMLVASIGQVFDLNDSQKQAIVQITNRKKAAQSLKASLKYYVAKKEYEKDKARQDMLANGYLHFDETNNEPDDYVPNQADLQVLRAKMVASAEAMKEEREHNKDLLPNDEQGDHIEIIKDQILDLNDKFDYLVKLMLQGQALNATSELKATPVYDFVKDEYGQEKQIEKGFIHKEETKFALVDFKTLVDGALNDGMLQKIPQDRLNHYVRMFETEAKK